MVVQRPPDRLGQNSGRFPLEIMCHYYQCLSSKPGVTANGRLSEQQPVSDNKDLTEQGKEYGTVEVIRLQHN